MNPKPMHEAVSPLKFLVGTWRSISAHGKYVDRVAPFVYNEELEISSLGQPVLNFKSTTWHATEKFPMHLETGFMRITPGTTRVTLLLAHNFGLTTIEEGHVHDGNSVMLRSTKVGRSPNVKEPLVTGIERHISLLDDGKLQSILYMSTSLNPEMTQHLAVIYEKL